MLSVLGPLLCNFQHIGSLMVHFSLTTALIKVLPYIQLLIVLKKAGHFVTSEGYRLPIID